MSKLTYTRVEYNFYDIDGLSVYLDIKSSENPEAKSLVFYISWTKADSHSLRFSQNNHLIHVGYLSLHMH